RVVGWHTSTYPIFVDVDSANLAATIANVAATTHAVTDLGTAYGVALKREAAPVARPSASICYNYLGNINFSHDDRLTLVPSTCSIGRGRGDGNHRGHELKLSGRIIDDCLVVDLSYSNAHSTEQMAEVLHQVRSELLQRSGLAPHESAAHIVLEPGTRTGLISYVPKELSRKLQAQRNFRNVMLTGATGYVGVHVLRELLSRSQAHVYCLVRGRSGITAAQRLDEVYEFYFGKDDRTDFHQRVTVLEGDVTSDAFGMPADIHRQLATEIDAIYHFAADTRLFGREEDFQRNNVFSAQQCIDFCRLARPKQFHYMSTLAVCGVNGHPEVIEFSERSSDVGQEFQNYYEATKFMAEQLVQEFRAAGGHGFIYRSGNVSGHSTTARFQRNASDNRFIQFLAACVKSGQLPRELGDPLVLSPIDEVAAGIVAISLDSHLSGGVFHVDSEHEVPIEQVFDALKDAGIDFEASDHATFASLFSALCDARDAGRRDPELALGFFWATRKPRNVRFNNAQTLAVMSRLGCTFSRLDEAWVSRFIDSLVASGVFVVPAQNEEWHARRQAKPRHQLALS
ncbi:MAG: SDR family oxidoreductase, partial [Lysobacter sp.]